MSYILYGFISYTVDSNWYLIINYTYYIHTHKKCVCLIERVTLFCGFSLSAVGSGSYLTTITEGLPTYFDNEHFKLDLDLDSRSRSEDLENLRFHQNVESIKYEVIILLIYLYIFN